MSISGMLSFYGKNEWLAILLIGLMLTVTLLILHWWIPAILVVIATIALHHEAELITLDADFVAISKLSPLQVQLLTRPNAT